MTSKQFVQVDLPETNHEIVGFYLVEFSPYLSSEELVFDPSK